MSAFTIAVMDFQALVRPRGVVQATRRRTAANFVMFDEAAPNKRGCLRG